MQPYDDRVEVPEGFEPVVEGAGDHPILAGIGGPWPYLLGFNELQAKPDAEILLRTGDGRPLLVVGQHGAGRTMAWASDIGPHWLPDAFCAWPGYGRLWRSFAGPRALTRVLTRRPLPFDDVAPRICR